MNTSNDSFLRDDWKIDFCKDLVGWVFSYYATVLFFNALSLFCCILHLTVIKRMEVLNNTKYLDILVLIVVVDIVTCLTNATQFLTDGKFFLPYNKVWAMIYTACVDTPPGMAYAMLASASCERYIALCKPFSYNKNVLIKHLKKWTATNWMVCPILHFCKYAIGFKEICLLSNGRVLFNAVYGEKAINLLLLSVPTSIIIFTQTYVIIELKKMKTRQQTPTDKNLQAQTKCILVMVLISFAYLGIRISAYLLSAITKETEKYDNLCMFIYWIFSSISGLTNAVTYGWIYPAYRSTMINTVKKCFCWKL